MGLRGVRADATYLLRTWVRTPGNLALSLLVPVILLLVFGLVFDGPDAPAAPRVGVEDLDGSPASARLLADLQAQGALQVAPVSVPATEDAAAWTQREGLAALVRVPAGFGGLVSSGQNASVGLVLATGDAYQASVVRVSVQAALAAASTPAVSIAESTAPAAPEPAYSSLLLPGVIGMSVLVVGLNMSFSSIAQLRESGLLQRLAVSPMTKAEWVIARMASQAVISLVVTTVLVVAALVVFRTPITLTPWTPLLVVGGTLVFAGLGTILGTLVRTVETGSIILSFVSLPLVIFSGSFFDVSVLPPYLRWVAGISPLKYLNDGLRADMILGDTAMAMRYAGALLISAVVVVVVGTRLIRWTPE